MDKNNIRLSYTGMIKNIFLLLVFLGIVNITSAQVIVPFTQRTSVYTPTKEIYNIRGDYQLIGNTNLTLVNYGNNTNNNNTMTYVDVDTDPNTLNSSSATLTFSSENGAIPECSNIIYAGLYWTGRADNGGTGPLTFSVTKNNVTVNFDKREVLMKGPGASSYTTVTTTSSNIYYPETNHGQMYSAYAEVTDYVRQYGLGEYFVANVALREGSGGGTGYYGGWGMIVIYENSKMSWRDVTIFDGHAYVAGQITANYTIPISGFNTIQNGNVNMKLGVIAGEGDVGISGDFFQIRDHTNTNWVTLNHSGNSSNNFFNSSIFTGGNPRNPNLQNNTGLDISMFNIPNANNSVITNNQTSTSFRYGTTQDTYIIFMLAMSVDAYVPTPEAISSVQSINGVPYVPGNPLVAEPGDEIVVQVEVRNKGTEAINNAELVVPIPFASSYVNSSRQTFFTPVPSPNTVNYNPSLGANGSIVWEIGTLPLPTDPTDLLGILTFTIKVTENCPILSNTNCDADIRINGLLNGTGQISLIPVNNQTFIQGYETSGVCIGEPITSPIIIEIDEQDYVNANCPVGTINNFVYCNATSNIPITQISGNFPSGSRFYNEYPVTQSSVEYTISNPFPATPGLQTYYAIPQGATTCYFEFTIEVLNVTSIPSVSASPVEYCLNDIAMPLTATPSNPTYTLYYYFSTTGLPQLSITPPTTTVGNTTYYVAEGLSSTCISPNKVPIQVVVNPLPEPPVSAVSDKTDICYDDNGNITLTANGGSGDILNWYSGSCNGALIGTGNNLSIPSPSATTTYYAAWENSCGISACADVTVTVLPVLNLSVNITSQVSFYNASDAEITASASGGTPPYTYSLNGGAPQLSGVFSNLSAGTYNMTVIDSFGCSATEQIIIDNAPEIIANDDNGTVNGMTGGTAVSNVLSNDLLNGLPLDPADVQISFISSTDPNVTLSGTDVLVAPGTPAGNYELVYEICEIANPANCDQATVFVTVTAAVIIANDDNAAGINGSAGASNVLNVFDNDQLNGSPVNPADVILTEITPDPNGYLTLNPDGSVDVAPFTPGGAYTITYQICEVLNPANCDQAVVTVQVIPTADVAITKTQISPANLPVGSPANLITVSPSVITAGTKIYYYLNVQNFGPDNSVNALITDIIPAGISNPEYSLNFGNSWFLWDGTRLLANFQYPGVNNILIRGDVDPSATGTIVNTATIYSPVTLDPNLANNESTLVTTINQSADLVLDKQVINSPVMIGGDIVYQISIFNSGPGVADNVIIQDIIDPAIIANPEYSTDGGVSWLTPWTGSLNIGTLNNQSTYTIRIRGTVIDVSPMPNVNPIPNTASVSSDTPDPNPGNNSETIFTPLDTDTDVSIVKTGPAFVVAGETIQYTITVTNNSNTFDATNVQLQDLINTNIISDAEYSDDAGVNWYPWTNLYVVGTLTPLQTFDILIRGNVLSSITADIPNTASVDSDTPDSDQTNNTSSINTPVQIISDLEVIKVQIDPAILPIDSAALFGNPYDLSISPQNITAGDTIYYALIYTNNGPSDVTNVLVDDIIPAGISDVTASRCQFSFAPWMGSISLGDIIAGGRCVLVIKGVVDDNAAGTLINTAVIGNTDGIFDPDLTNNTSTVVTDVRSQADLSIEKTVNNSNPYVGDNIEFTVTVTNNGPNPATGVEVNDLLPNGYSYVSHSTASGSYDHTTGIWTIGNVGFPGSVVLTISVDVNMPAPGINYQNIATITNLDQLDPDPTNNTDDEITSPVNIIIANDDNGGPVNGFTGSTNVLNVFGNDLLNGAPVDPAALTLTVTVPNPAGYLILNSDGSVDVAPGTPAGSHSLTYQICEIANPGNCDDALVTIIVESAVITAVDDDVTGVNGYTGQNDVLNVFDNDLLNGFPVNPANVNLTETIADPTGALTLNPDGSVDVAPGTPAGTYTLTYEICEILNPTNCDDAVVTVTVIAAPIVANDDNAFDINGYTGQNDVLNVFDNDELNGSPVIPAEVTLTETIADPTGALTLNPDGSVDVAPGTPAGTYTLTYEICEILNPTNCDDAVVTVTVIAAPIVANDDNAFDINGYTGQNNVLNVFDNDELNGSPVIPAEVTLTETIADPTGALTLNPDGSVDVAPGTPAGTYTLTYEICEILNPGNCDIADVIVTVDPPVIVAVDDFAFDIVGHAGASAVLNVFDNDLLNGIAVNPAQVTLIETIPEINGYLTLNPDGTVDVVPGTPAGTYYLTYQICEILNPANCDDAQAFITVIAALIVANDDNAFDINGYTGQNNVLNVFDNDELNGVPVIPAEVTLTETVADPTGALTLNPDGSVDVAPGTPAGTYTLTYEICEILNPTNCDDAVVTVTVIAAPIVANDDNAIDINGYTGQNDVLNVFDNDELNGSPVIPAEVTLTETIADPTGALTLNHDGSVDVAPGTPAGTYILTYEICEILNPTNCDDAVVTVTVIAAPIVANDDNAIDINGYTGQNDVLNVFDNDEVNGVPVIPAEVTLTETVADPTGALTLNPDGSVDVAPGTPAGTYTLTYEICEILNPTNCDDALVTVTVIAAPIVANDDNAIDINGYTGQNDVLNVFDNDELNGSPVIPAEVTLTETIADPTGALTLNPDGSVDVAPGTPAGTYTLTYEICEILNPTNCDDAVVTVTVIAAPIVANDDNAIDINGYTGQNDVLNVFDNDEVNGVPVIPAEVTLTETVADPTGALTLNPDGSVDVAPGTPAGTYTLTYEICEILNPTNCDDALVTVTVIAAPIVANDDNAIDINGYTGQNDVLNVFDNDLLNGSPVIPAEVTLTETIADPTGALTLNPDGSVDVAPGTPAGTYTLTYEICEILNPTNCDDAVVTVTVIAAPIVANDDNAIDINGYTGQNDVLNVFDNDELNGSPVIPAEVTLTETIADPTGALTLNPDGSVDVAPGTPAGTYTLTYEICEILNPTNCDDALVTVTVIAAPIVAVDDVVTGISGGFGAAGVVNIFDNDSLNGVPVIPSEITLAEIIPDPAGVLTLNPDGTVDVAPGTPPGTYTLTYEICEILNPSNCDQALVTVIVVNDPPIAMDDFNNTHMNTPIWGNVLTNDWDPNGDPITINTVPVTNPVNGTLGLNPDGSYIYTPNFGFTGVDTFVYEICDNGTPALCDSALVTIIVYPGFTPAENNPPVANNDVYEGIINVAVIGNVISNDWDPDGNLDPNSVTLIGAPPANGTLVLNPDGTFSFTPDVNFTGIVTFEYEICDTGMPVYCDMATVTITIYPNPFNDNYTFAVDDSYAGMEDNSITGNVLDNDYDPEGDNQFVNPIPVVPPVNGTVTLNVDGSFIYIPNPNYWGPDQFVYEVCDDGIPVSCDQATVYLMLFPVNDPPVTVNEYHTICNNSFASGNIFNGDYDPDTTALEVGPVVQLPANGSFVTDSLGNYIYTPDAGFAGIDTVIVDICDTGFPLPAECSHDTIFITVYPEVLITAGGNDTICSDESYLLAGASVVNHGSIFWTTNGTGTFDNHYAMNPVYTPGVTDIMNGSVTLTMHATPQYSVCDNVSASMVLSITPKAEIYTATNLVNCLGGSYAFQGVSVANSTGILWTSSGDGSFSDDAIANPVYTPGAGDLMAGSVVLTITAQSEAPCSPVSQQIILTYAPELTADITQPSCNGETGEAINQCNRRQRPIFLRPQWRHTTGRKYLYRTCSR
jgi:uncharacterized repeat protein (TIGR01451 family)